MDFFPPGRKRSLLRIHFQPSPFLMKIMYMENQFFFETIISSVCAKRPCLTDHHADDVKSSLHTLVGLVLI